MPIRKNATPDPERQMMIKTKACQRMIKEVNFYMNEVKENETKLAEMKARNEDPYDIKKFEEVLGESYMMVPDSNSRLKQTLEDLASYLESMEGKEEYMSNEWYQQGVDLLKREKNRFDVHGDTVQETRVDDIAEGELF